MSKTYFKSLNKILRSPSIDHSNPDALKRRTIDRKTKFRKPVLQLSNIMFVTSSYNVWNILIFRIQWLTTFSDKFVNQRFLVFSPVSFLDITSESFSSGRK